MNYKDYTMSMTGHNNDTLTSARQKNLILYQSDCSFCNWCRRFIEKRDIQCTFSFISIQSKEATTLSLKYHFQIDTNPESIVVITTANTTLTKWRACTYIGIQLTTPIRIITNLLSLTPVWFGDALYDLASKNRNMLCKIVRC